LSRQAARTLAGTEIVHGGLEPHEIIKRLTAHRLMGMTVPERYGGAGADEVSHVLTLMEISKSSASAGGLLVWNNSLYCSFVLRYGKEEQKNKYLSRSLSGEKPGCFVLMGDAMSPDVRTSMVPDGPGWRIRGEGNFFPCGIPSGIAVAVSREGGTSLTFMLMDLENQTGLLRGKPLERGGIFISGIAEMIFENARVTADAILCRGDEGAHAVQGIMRESWMGLGALAAGIGRGTMEEVLDFARNEQGSGKVSQVTEWKVADMGVELEASELLVLKAAWMKDHGKSYEKESAAAKAFSVAAALKASLEGLQILGTKNPKRRISVEQRMRDAEMCQAYYGTREKLGYVVAEHLGRGKITES
jgi:alkylation response protein AidB-like acyl-CoA dehydrogenase